MVSRLDRRNVILDATAMPETELVLLDLRMPGLTGLDLLHRIRLRRPDVGVVIATVVIVAGSCIFVAIVRWLGAEECLVSEADILDGLVASLG